jgi:hypothetical protein
MYVDDKGATPNKQNKRVTKTKCLSCAAKGERGNKQT